MVCPLCNLHLCYHIFVTLLSYNKALIHNYYLLTYFCIARVRIPPEYLDKVVWDDSLPLSYLVPTLTGPGVCTVALVDVLVLAHNEFVEKCHKNQMKTK